MTNATSPRPVLATGSVVGVALFSHDPARLAAVYEQLLDLAFEHRVHADGCEHWVTTVGGVQIELKALRTAAGSPTSDAVGDEASGTSRSELSFAVPDVAAAIGRALELGCTNHQPPITFSWGTFGTVVDPDGNRIGLFTPPTSTANSQTEVTA